MVAIAAATTAGGLLPALPAAPAQAAPARYADDFNGDGYRDYAAYHPGLSAVGGVRVTYGTAPGPGSRRQVIDQNSVGVPGTNETGDMFGEFRTSADFNRDGYADLFADSSLHPAVRLPGSASGITTTGLTQLADQYVIDGILQ
ncbi:FG-GAP-like repeat-containing protein [Streptomyces millisiae]|uniref:FG-GAP-like repeat-containing protein n=1 Tax=Streptomyces millisiae TaxID=3075542 RepID=A0ABU2LQY6_9ACTN|nr:FG-GAP-like repeat-containing protein [Streptomyces sp. DSM 44918]MDT0320004.1 FG-GAP-like repeat-containing protein [Streptomyces sp. DSM 44918]